MYGRSDDEMRAEIDRLKVKTAKIVELQDEWASLQMNLVNKGVELANFMDENSGDLPDFVNEYRNEWTKEWEAIFDKMKLNEEKRKIAAL